MTREDFDVWVLAVHRPIVFWDVFADRPEGMAKTGLVSRAEWIAPFGGEEAASPVPNDPWPFPWRETSFYCPWFVPCAATDDCRDARDGVCNGSCGWWDDKGSMVASDFDREFTIDGE